MGNTSESLQRGTLGPVMDRLAVAQCSVSIVVEEQQKNTEVELEKLEIFLSLNGVRTCDSCHH